MTVNDCNRAIFARTQLKDMKLLRFVSLYMYSISSDTWHRVSLSVQ